MWNNTDIPLAYLFIFRSYGTWLHGDERGSIDRYHNAFESSYMSPNEKWKEHNAQTLKGEPVILNTTQRESVEKSVRETCDKRNWLLRAFNVRTNHVHVVVSIGEVKPEIALNAFKANATRQMRQDGCWQQEYSPWADKGSKRRLWNERSIERAIDYVINGQGGPIPDFNKDDKNAYPPATAGGTDTTNALTTLLSELIDYAGLFPPAALSMREAVKNYARYIESEYSWMLARFVLPLSRLDEFEKEAKEFLNPPATAGGTDKINIWRLSALCGANEDELKTIEDFNLRYEGKAIIDAIEIKANSTVDVSTACAYGRVRNLLIFCEIPIMETNLINAIADAGCYAKARTGGIKQDMFPTAEEIARFIFACHKSNAAFKATAGLHHPIRCVKPLTYEEDAEQGKMHGFLNVFLAATFIRNGMSENEAVELLLDENISSFTFEDDSISWRSFRINADELKEARENFALSFGSCSFEEPIEDLKELGVLKI